MRGAGRARSRSCHGPESARGGGRVQLTPSPRPRVFPLLYGTPPAAPLESALPPVLGTVCMIRTRSSMSKHSPQFCGVLGHTFMEFLKGSGDYCQAQHDLYADK
ncbi:uncharacterized protein LOC144762747 [Lissotriton helveticus]